VFENIPKSVGTNDLMFGGKHVRKQKEIVFSK